MIVGGALRVDGIISANGSDSYNHGGGSGGSIWLTASNFDGTGLLQANGGYGAQAGDTSNGGGGGGGGRIAVYFDNSSFTGVMQSKGGAGYVYGGAGTVFVKPTGGRSTLFVNNAGSAGATTEFGGLVSFDGNLVVGPGAILGSVPGINVQFNFTGDVTVQTNGALSVSYRGYGPGDGPGTGLATGNWRGAQIERELRRLTDNIASSLRESANVLQRTSHQISNTGYA
jgi:hypothetical protein